MPTIRILVSGRVQGVGFRNFVQREAAGLSLRGWVRNLPDGALEVAAQGSPANLDKLERNLLRAPSPARVDRVQRFAWPTVEIELLKMAGFEIRF